MNNDTYILDNAEEDTLVLDNNPVVDVVGVEEEIYDDTTEDTLVPTMIFNNTIPPITQNDMKTIPLNPQACVSDCYNNNKSKISVRSTQSIPKPVTQQTVLPQINKSVQQQTVLPQINKSVQQQKSEQPVLPQINKSVQQQPITQQPVLPQIPPVTATQIFNYPKPAQPVQQQTYFPPAASPIVSRQQSAPKKSFGFVKPAQSVQQEPVVEQPKQVSQQVLPAINKPVLPQIQKPVQQDFEPGYAVLSVNSGSNNNNPFMTSNQVALMNNSLANIYNGSMSSSKNASKKLIPYLIWNGEYEITNMKSLNSSNKNILQNRVKPYDSEEMLKLLKPFVDQDVARYGSFYNFGFNRFLIANEPIIFAVLYPKTITARDAWKMAAKNNKFFFDLIDQFNADQVAELANIYNVSSEDIVKSIEEIMKEYYEINKSKIINKSLPTEEKKRCNDISPAKRVGYNRELVNTNPCTYVYTPTTKNVNGKPFTEIVKSEQIPEVNVSASENNNSSNNFANVVTESDKPMTRKECLATAPKQKGFRRSLVSLNPCKVKYIEMQNKKDASDKIVGTVVNNPLYTDSECLYKYHMIKDFLDATNTHLVKNAKKSKKTTKTKKTAKKN